MTATPRRRGRAFDAVPRDLERLVADLRVRGLGEPAQIVAASILIARTRNCGSGRPGGGRRHRAAGQAMTTATEYFAQILAELDDPVLAARAADVRAVGHRLAAAVAGHALSE